MSAKLPSSNKEYKDPRYWNERFQQEDYYEWLVDYKEIKPALFRIFYLISLHIREMDWTGPSLILLDSVLVLLLFLSLGNIPLQQSTAGWLWRSC